MNNPLTTASTTKPLYLRVPELTLLLVLVVISYVLIALFSSISTAHETKDHFILLYMIGSFLLSLLLAIISVMGGIGGGVIFTPLVLGFTSIDSLVVRATGLIVAMFSGLISAGPLMRSGLADIKLVFFSAVPIIIGSILGANFAIYFANEFGAQGGAVIRLVLGLMILCIAFVFLINGNKSNIPTNETAGPLAKNLGLFGYYWDKKLDKNIEYKVRRGRYGLLLLLIIGLFGGFFGLGGGWAVVPIFNLLMYVPLKVAVGTSGVLLSLSNAAAIWPYIKVGALIPLIAAPWMLGQVFGGVIGAHVLSNINANFIRKLLICLLFLASVKLLARGVEGLFNINLPI